MLTRSTRSLLSVSSQRKTIPVIENRTLFSRALDASQITTILLRHCNLFELRPMLDHAFEREVAVYVNVDHIDGIHPDTAGLRYLAHQLHIAGIVSSNPRILALGKSFDLETIQRIFAVDSTGLEAALESVDSHHVDLLDISPALVIPYVVSQTPLPLPFIGSGLISTFQQTQAVLRAGALHVAVARPELWM
jgi:glycerol uptake operon antiterminator